jgi:hypothetical protein
VGAASASVKRADEPEPPYDGSRSSRVDVGGARDGRRSVGSMRAI